MEIAIVGRMAAVPNEDTQSVAAPMRAALRGFVNAAAIVVMG